MRLLVLYTKNKSGLYDAFCPFCHDLISVGNRDIEQARSHITELVKDLFETFETVGIGFDMLEDTVITSDGEELVEYIEVD